MDSKCKAQNHDQAKQQRLLRQDEFARQPHPDGIRIPLVIKLTIVIFVGVFVSTALLVILSRSPISRLDLFAAYASVFPGQPRINAEARGFRCVVLESGYEQFEQCWLYPTTGIFSRIQLFIDHNTIDTITFVPRESTLTRGDLVLLLGLPQRNEVIDYWNPVNIAALASRNVNRSNYFVPVIYITIGRTDYP